MKSIIMLSFAAAAMATSFWKCECLVDENHHGPLTQTTCNDRYNGACHYDGNACVANDKHNLMNQDRFGSACEDEWQLKFGTYRGRSGVRCWQA
ncbi:hypothetical protein E4U54_006883 [Claviceps lovelessii]|nr:hypothetical protein E4U54_006883 [Claviceps lovelessii]